MMLKPDSAATLRLLECNLKCNWDPLEREGGIGPEMSPLLESSLKSAG